MRAGTLVAVVSAMVGTAWVARLHEGGYANVSMPALAAVALVLSCLLGRVLRSGRSTRRVVGDRFLVILSRLPGQVFVPTHPYYMRLDGLPPSPRPLRSSDIYRIRAGPELLSGTLPWNLDGVSTLILDNLSDVGMFGDAVTHGFTPVTLTLLPDSLFQPLSDLPAHPRVL